MIFRKKNAQYTPRWVVDLRFIPENTIGSVETQTKSSANSLHDEYNNRENLTVCQTSHSLLLPQVSYLHHPIEPHLEPYRQIRLINV